jgi:hypothetical protein
VVSQHASTEGAVLTWSPFPNAAHRLASQFRAILDVPGHLFFFKNLIVVSFLLILYFLLIPRRVHIVTHFLSFLYGLSTLYPFLTLQFFVLFVLFG